MVGGGGGLVTGPLWPNRTDVFQCKTGARSFSLFLLSSPVVSALVVCFFFVLFPAPSLPSSLSPPPPASLPLTHSRIKKTSVVAHGAAGVRSLAAEARCANKSGGAASSRAEIGFPGAAPLPGETSRFD